MHFCVKKIIKYSKPIDKTRVWEYDKGVFTFFDIGSEYNKIQEVTKMTNAKATKRALLSSALSLVLCFTMLLGTTFAWFTDSVSSANNIIKSGNLDVVLEYKTDWNDEWKVVDENTKLFKEGAFYEPGYTEVVFLRVSNAGTLDLKYDLKVNINSETPSTNVYGEEFSLSDYLQVGTYIQDEYNYGFNYADILMPIMFGSRETALSNVDDMTTLSEFDGVVRKDAPVLSGEKTAQVAVLVLSMPETVGNEANYDAAFAAPEIDLGITLLATQLASENDSFGNEYDVEATYPLYVQKTKQEGKALSITAGEMKITVPAAAPAGTYAITISNKNVTTVNGETTLAMDIDLKHNGVQVEETDGITYTLTALVGPGMNVTKVMHKGMAIESFTYSALTGKLTFTTASFSPFAIVYSEIKGLNPAAKYLASGTDIHSTTTLSGLFQLVSDVKTSDYGDNSRYGYGYEYIIRNQADYTLDLNGKTLTHDTVNANANKNAFTYTFVANHAGTKLTIGGEGKVYSHNSEGYTCAIQGKDGTLITINGGEFEVTDGIAVWAGAGSHIIINGGTFINGNATTDHELIYSSGGVIDIYGGFFHNTDGNYTLNVEDRNRATGFINVYGGTFVNFDPSTGGQDPNNIKVADGYTVISETQANGDIWYTVVPV